MVRSVDGALFIDEGEARQFSGEVNLISAAKAIHAIGPKTVVLKRGEHGVLLFNSDTIFAAPAFPLGLRRTYLYQPRGYGVCVSASVPAISISTLTTMTWLLSW